MIFLNSGSSAAALVFYQPFSGPSMKSSVHTKRVQNIFQKFGKNTIFDEHPVAKMLEIQKYRDATCLLNTLVPLADYTDRRTLD